MKTRRPTPTQEGLRALGEARFAVNTALMTDPRWATPEGEELGRKMIDAIDKASDGFTPLDPETSGAAVRKFGINTAKAVALSIAEFNAAAEIRRGIETGDDGKIVYHSRHVLRLREKGNGVRLTPGIFPDIPAHATDEEIIKICEEWVDAIDHGTLEDVLRHE